MNKTLGGSLKTIYSFTHWSSSHEKYYSFGGLEDDFVLPVASKHGVITDTLFWWTMAITGVVFIVTHIFLFGFSWKYQHRENQVAYFYPHNNKLEMIWTITPAIVLVFLFVMLLKFVDLLEPINLPKGTVPEILNSLFMR